MIPKAIPMQTRKVYTLKFVGAKSALEEEFSSLENAMDYANKHAKYTFGIERLNFSQRGAWRWVVWIASMYYEIDETELDPEFESNALYDIERDAWLKYKQAMKTGKS